MSPGDEGREDARRANLRVQTEDPAWERRIREHFAGLPWMCLGPCVAIDFGAGTNGARHVKLVETGGVSDWMIEPGAPPCGREATTPTEPRPEPSSTALRANSQVEVRPFEGRQIYVDGKPVGEPFR